VYESFDKYCEVEVLEGENRYRTDSHGLQDAEKGLKFEVLPPVLQLHLRRFDYDYQRDTMLKVSGGGLTGWGWERGAGYRLNACEEQRHDSPPHPPSCFPPTS